MNERTRTFILQVLQGYERRVSSRAGATSYLVKQERLQREAELAREAANSLRGVAIDPKPGDVLLKLSEVYSELEAGSEVEVLLERHVDPSQQWQDLVLFAGRLFYLSTKAAITRIHWPGRHMLYATPIASPANCLYRIKPETEPSLSRLERQALARRSALVCW